jgi:hypothetical protein
VASGHRARRGEMLRSKQKPRLAWEQSAVPERAAAAGREGGRAAGWGSSSRRPECRGTAAVAAGRREGPAGGEEILRRGFGTPCRRYVWSLLLVHF